MEGRICVRCNEFKLWEYFPNHKSFLSGRASACKECIAKRRTEKKLLFKETKSALASSMDEPTKKGAEIVLTSLGYELYNPENPVYLQFEERMWVKYGITLSQ